jgi:uncharacterized protein YjbJ (UPF0337 family)
LWNVKLQWLLKIALPHVGMDDPRFDPECRRIAALSAAAHRLHCIQRRPPKWPTYSGAAPNIILELPSIRPLLAGAVLVFSILGDRIMNKDQAKGAVKKAAGKVQQQAGKLTGSREQQAKGMEKQVAGKVQQTAGDAKEAIKNPPKHH